MTVWIETTQHQILTNQLWTNWLWIISERQSRLLYLLDATTTTTQCLVTLLDLTWVTDWLDWLPWQIVGIINQLNEPWNPNCCLFMSRLSTSNDRDVCHFSARHSRVCYKWNTWGAWSWSCPGIVLTCPDIVRRGCCIRTWV